MPHILDGKAIAAQVRTELIEQTQHLKATHGITPGIGLLLVGDNPASQVYVRSKAKTCEELGYYSVVLHRPPETSEEDVLKQVHTWNADPAIHGILVQLPLPKHIDEHRVLLAIAPSKDVDGFHPENVGRLVAGLPGFVPCTPAGVMEIIKRANIDTKGKHAVVLGRSNIVGKPMANLLYQKNANANAIVTICHTAAPDWTQYTRQADILVAAVGVAEMVKGEHLKEGVVVLDVGINRIDDATTKSGTRLVGDVEFTSASERASAITPIPGGVGPMTIAMLMLNTFRSASGEVYGKKKS
jgi:methylenetetrahydrofolate dehydrogenase (NADP+)/methenyltetrahydrofolate cyclohydrolase